MSLLTHRAVLLWLTEDDAEKRIAPIMRAMATDESGTVVKEDARGALGMFRWNGRRDRRAQNQDDWRTYLSKHAAMVLCGQLLDGDSPGQGDEERYFGPAMYLENHGLTTGSGTTWTADRRRPVPQNCRLTIRTPEDEWLAQIDDIESDGLIDTDHEVCVWGYWNARFGSILRRIRVTTALASRATAPALVRALETTKDPMNFRLPDTDTSFEFGSPRHVLLGWVTDHGAVSDLDGHDPWAAAMSMGMLRPRQWVIDRMLLSEDRLGCLWTAPNIERYVERQSWANGERYGDEERDQGDRLMASCAFVDDVCVQTGMALLREVTVTHSVVGSPHVGDRKRRMRVSLRLIA